MATQAPADGRVDAHAGDCPRCGSAYAPFQQYCLECGLRLPVDDAAEPQPPYLGFLPADEPWLWPLLATFVAAVLAIAAVLALRLADDGSEELLVATTSPPVMPATQPPPTVEPPVPTLPTPAEPRPSGTTSVRTATEARRGDLIPWPARDGWTIVLLSAASRETATARAREASEAGVDDVGVLNSSEYASLHPGYFVVFAGVFDSSSEANEALGDVQSDGYEAAYIRQITRSR